MFWTGSTASKREAFDVGDDIFESCVTLRDASELVPWQTKKQLCSISSCADLPNRNQETSDECQKVIAWLGFEHRVIVCRDGIQWIAQRRKKGGAERPWRSLGYFRSREALIGFCATLFGRLDPTAWAALAVPPEMIGGER